MANNAEDMKASSNGLRGTIADNLLDQDSKISDDNNVLLKFHGSYQQDNRDARVERKKQGLDREFIFMVRGKMPGGDVTAEQYLQFDRLADEAGNATLRITSRQGFQLHGIVKQNLKKVIATINHINLTTYGACGDVVRNTLAPAAPLAIPAYNEMHELAREISRAFLPKSHGYLEIWLDGEKLQADEPDPIYGTHYLPRKFKIAFAVPPRNDVDVYTNDLGYIADVIDGHVRGYTLIVGGGMGMTHGNQKTYPALAKPLFYIGKEDAMAAAMAIVATQREFGDRQDRSHARLKYLVHERGIDWFRDQVMSRIDFPVEEPREVHWDTVGDMLGWHEQGDGKLFCGVWVQDGRIIDAGEHRYRTAFREIASRFGFPMRLTCNTNIYFSGIAPEQKAQVEALLREHGVKAGEELTEARKTSQACVALPTCGLALTESERVFGEIMSAIDGILEEMGLQSEPLLIRITGCPNGCARPYNADISFVGRAPLRYAVYAGGSSSGTRLAGMVHKMITKDQIPVVVRGFLQDFVATRQPAETFSHWWGRTQLPGEAPSTDQFHTELAERATKLKGTKAVPAE